jgi:hypothetical protein
VHLGIQPPESVQLIAVRKAGHLIIHIENPSPSVIRAALQEPHFVQWTDSYNRAVKNLFKDNAILMKKWIRYGENMRNQQ